MSLPSKRYVLAKNSIWDCHIEDYVYCQKMNPFRNDQFFWVKWVMEYDALRTKCAELNEAWENEEKCSG